MLSLGRQRMGARKSTVAMQQGRMHMKRSTDMKRGSCSMTACLAEPTMVQVEQLMMTCIPDL